MACRAIDYRTQRLLISLRSFLMNFASRNFELAPKYIDNRPFSSY